MINILHLLWIIPLSAVFGLFTGCLMAVAKEADKEHMYVKHEHTDNAKT